MVWRLALTWTPRLALTWTTWQFSINELSDEQVLHLFKFFDYTSLFHVGHTSKTDYESWQILQSLALSVQSRIRRSRPSIEELLPSCI